MTRIIDDAIKNWRCYECSSWIDAHDQSRPGWGDCKSATKFVEPPEPLKIEALRTYKDFGCRNWSPKEN